MSHAVFSPSSAKRWIQCPGSIALSVGIPDKSSEFALEGTAAHEMAALCLVGGGPDVNTAAFIGLESRDVPGLTFTAEMAEHVQTYVDEVRSRAASGLDLAVEQAVSMEPDVPGCWGTSDAVILREDEIEVLDLKFGRGVRVDAERNEQLMLYALGAYLRFGAALLDVKRVRMTIHQPRLDHLSEWSCSVYELFEFAATAAEAQTVAEACLDNPALALAHLNPSEDACRFCRAKATCPALQSAVENAVGIPIASAFMDLDAPGAVAPALHEQMAAVGLVEDWCKAIRARCESALLAGGSVPGFKLVQGRAGARQWSDADAVEAYLKKTVRLPDQHAYDMKLISPTSAEKLLKKEILGERQWARLEEFITRTEGSLSVAPANDKRPEVRVTTAADVFQAMPAIQLPLPLDA